jgi:hypothetical protein
MTDTTVHSNSLIQTPTVQNSSLKAANGPNVKTKTTLVTAILSIGFKAAIGKFAASNAVRLGHPFSLISKCLSYQGNKKPKVKFKLSYKFSY